MVKENQFKKSDVDEVIYEALRKLFKEKPNDWPSPLRYGLGQLPHSHLRIISTYISLLLESSCNNKDCQDECEQHRSQS